VHCHHQVAPFGRLSTGDARASAPAAATYRTTVANVATVTTANAGAIEFAARAEGRDMEVIADAPNFSWHVQPPACAELTATC
jgi:hypothetical protein